MWQGCQATTNFANQLGWRFLHMTCGTLWMWKLKNGHLFFRNQGPVLQSCPEHPGKAIPVEQTQPVTSSAIRLDSLMALRPMLRWTLLRCNDWCPADGSYQRGIVFFFCTFLDVFFQRILDPENRLKTQNRLLKKLQRKSRKNATVAFWETKRPPMWSQTQTWVFLVLVDPWKFTHIDMLLPFCTYFFPHSTENIGVLHLTSHLTPSDALMDWPAPAWLEKSQAGWITPLLLLVKVWSSQPWPQGIPGDTWGYPGRYDWMCPFSDKDEAGTTTASAIFLLFCILQFFVKFRPQRIRESS